MKNWMLRLIAINLLLGWPLVLHALNLNNQTDTQVHVEVRGDFDQLCYSAYLDPKASIRYFPSIIRCQSSDLSITFKTLQFGESGECLIRAGSGAHINFDGSNCQGC